MKRISSFDPLEEKDLKKPNTQDKTPIFPSHLSGSAEDKDTHNDVTELWITVIDVGQGESTLIRYRKKEGEKWKDVHVVLVDGGRSHFAEHTIKPTLKKLDVDRIDTMVCTHYDADHMEGLSDLLNTYDPDTVYERSTEVRSDDDKVKKFRDAANGKNVALKKGKVIYLDEEEEEGSPSIKCLCVNGKGSLWKDENDYSIGLLLEFGEFSFYLGGDLTSDIEDSLALDRHVCAFKCGHHGSKHSTSTTFLGKITPCAAFISAASHSYCHPDDETIQRLCDADSVKKIYLTNCVYNRAGINAGFKDTEEKIKEEIYNKILKWIKSNQVLIGNKPGGFDAILKLGTFGDEVKTKEAFVNLLKADKLVIKSGQIRNHLPGDVNTDNRKSWNELASLYYAAYNAHEKFDERIKRNATKGCVAASKTHLGNIHLIVSGEDAAAGNEKFTVYFSDGAEKDPKMKMIAHECGKEAGAEADADRKDVEFVTRDESYAFTSSFSMITGPSGEERANITPDEVLNLAEGINQLWNQIESSVNEEFLKGVAEVLDGDDLTGSKVTGLEQFFIEYEELLELYDMVNDEFGAKNAENEENKVVYDLKNPAIELRKPLGDALQQFENDDMNDSDFEYK